MTEKVVTITSDDEEALKKEITKACMTSIVTYLNEVADTMNANNMVAITATDLRAMADAMKQRISQ